MWHKTIEKTFDKYIGVTREMYEEPSQTTGVGQIVEKMKEERISVKQAKSRTLGSHVLP